MSWSTATLRPLLLAAIGILVFLNGFAAPSASAAEPIHIFFSAGCADCWPYVQDTLTRALRQAGIEAPTEIHDYTIPEERARLLEMADGLEVPRSIANSLYVFVPYQEKDIVILGHVPPDLVQEMLAYQELPNRLIIWQPEMHGEPTEYRLWAWRGEVKSFDIDEPFAQALAEAQQAAGLLPVGLANLGQLLPAVVVTGLLDSVNPCAFAVILLLLAFLFTLRKSRGRILQLGAVYIGMIFLVYFAIGLGLLQAVRFSENPHFVATVGSWILIGLGAINLAEYFFPAFPIKLRMPKIAGRKQMS